MSRSPSRILLKKDNLGNLAIFTRQKAAKLFSRKPEDLQPVDVAKTELREGSFEFPEQLLSKAATGGVP